MTFKHPPQRSRAPGLHTADSHPVDFRSSDHLPSTPRAPDLRRRGSLAMLAGFVLASTGCGSGGGGGDDSASANPPGNSQPPGNPGDTGNTGNGGGNGGSGGGGGGNGGRIPEAAPITGSFGGGQGRILFVGSDKTFSEIDLTSRIVTKLVDIGGRYNAKIRGGLTRAGNGRIAVLVDTGELDAQVEMRIYSAAGALELTHPGYFWGIHMKDGAAISPDGQYVAVVAIGPLDNDWQNDYMVVVLTRVESGERRLLLVEKAKDLDVTPTLCWSPDNTLHLMTNTALYRIDGQTGGITKLHTLDLAPPYASMVTADGREIWFHQGRGNQYGGTIWSVDIASGQARRRSLRSAGWGQHCPVISPDGQWMLGQEGITKSDFATTIWVDMYITAIRVTDPPIDVHNLPDEVLDAAGAKLGSSSRMAWY
ncbi:MAG: hypothetical protein QM674_14525 [Burkholderiaceae bacterium]